MSALEVEVDPPHGLPGTPIEAADGLDEEVRRGIMYERRRILTFLAAAYAFGEDEEGRETADWIAKFVRSGRRYEDMTPELASAIWREMLERMDATTDDADEDGDEE